MMTPTSESEEERLEDPEIEDALTSLASARRPAIGAVLRSLQGLLQRANRPRVEDNRYTLLRELGRGGMGVVWLAHDRQLDRHVAVKRLSSEASSSFARFGREARSIARIAHPNVVEIFDISLWTHPAYIVMAYVEGPTLRARVVGDPAMGWREIVGLYQQAARGLEAAHALGLIHRDFKPDNALLDASGVVKVVDFGLTAAPDGEPAASSGQALDTADTSITRTANFLGTPAYMSPQQLEGLPPSSSDDLYAWGVSLWEALYGDLPFAASTVGALRRAKQGGAPERPRGSGVPARVHAVLRRALHPERRQRWRSVAALSAALADAQRSRAPAWRWWLGVAGVVAVAGAVTMRPTNDGCTAPIDPLRQRWAAQREAIDDPTVRRTLDAYVDDWVTRYAAACGAGNGRGVLERRSCLRGELGQVFADPRTLPDPEGIDRTDRCADSERARIEWPPARRRGRVHALQQYGARNLRRPVVGGGLGPELAANLDEARAIGHGPTTALLLYLTARTDNTRPFQERKKLLEDAVERADASGADRLAMRCAALLAEVLQRLDAPPDAVQAWLDYADSRDGRLARRDDAQLAVANSHALILLEWGQPHEALDVAEAALAWADESNSAPQLMGLLGRTANALTSLGRHREAVDRLRQLVADARRHDIAPGRLADHLGNLGVALQRAGEDDAAIESFEAQLQTLRAVAEPSPDRTFDELNIARGLGLRPRTRPTAIALLRGITAEADVGTDVHARAAYSLGEVLEADGELEAAADAFGTARVSVDLAFGPDSPHALDVRARIAGLGSP